MNDKYDEHFGLLPEYVRSLNVEITRLTELAERYRKALEFYAATTNYEYRTIPSDDKSKMYLVNHVDGDKGELARAALAEGMK